MTEDLVYQVALGLTPHIGPIIGKTLISYCGSAQAVFTSSKSALAKIPGIGQITASHIVQDPYLTLAAKEIEACSKKSIEVISYLDKQYPYRLKNIDSCPIVLYKRGSLDLNPHRSIAIVGTRTPTAAGRMFAEKLVEDLKKTNATIVSGFAYGVDTIAHRKCVETKTPTIAVLGNGLDTIYPGENRELHDKILADGGALLSEFTLGIGPDRNNFPMRNRIIAAISDATIVVESKAKGGSIITAEMANDFNKDVFAVPGRPTDSHSAGCNNLIKKNKAHLLESADDLIYIMRWDVLDQKKSVQTTLFLELEPAEQVIFELLKASKEMSIDDICYQTQQTISSVSSTLLSMEFKGVVKSLPGKVYCLRG